MSELEEFMEWVGDKTTLSAEIEEMEDATVVARSGTKIIMYFTTNECDIEQYGKYHYYNSGASDEVPHLERYFEDPTKPTDEELMLFEIEFGRKYPLLEYMLQEGVL